MSEKFPAYDSESDRLIAILTNTDSSPAEKQRVAQQLYHRHSEWVNQRISRHFYNPADVQDIAQVVWMVALDPKTLKREYVDPNGRFRAYLNNPLRWAMGKHMDKMQYKVDEKGKKDFSVNVPIGETQFQDAMTGHRISQMIDTVIKPNLTHLTLAVRNVFMLNEHDVLFEEAPDVSEIADIHRITTVEAEGLLESSASKKTQEYGDDEFSVRVPVNYDSIIDRSQLNRNSTVYFSGVMGVTQAAYRKRLHTGRKFLIQTVRDNMLPDETEVVNHGSK